MNLKYQLKKNKLIYNLNAKIKEFSLIYNWKKLEAKHLDRLKNVNEIYSENNIFEEVRIKISKKINNKGKHHVLWVGTDENQDRSGFNQALEKLFNVSYYYNSKGNYGLNTINKKGKKISFCTEVADDNGNKLVKLFNEINEVNKIDFVFGQIIFLISFNIFPNLIFVCNC